MRLPLTSLLMLLAMGREPAADTPHWFEVRTAHFDVLTDSTPIRAKHVAVQLEEMRNVFRTLLPDPAPEASPVVVLALKDRKSFRTVEPSAYLTKGSLNLAGLFLRTPDRNYILLCLDTADEHAYSTVYHEYTHYILRGASLPLWLSEGLAEFYQATQIGAKDIVLGLSNTSELQHLRQHRLLPLTTLLAVGRASPYYHEEEKGTIFYAESWALTHYIIAEDRRNGTNRLADYTAAITKGIDPVTAAEQIFGDLNILQKHLEEYIARGDLMTFRMNSSVILEEQSLEAASLPAADADAIRADVLVYNGRTEEAHTLIQSVLRDDPRNPLVHESLGYLEFKKGNFAAAKKWYGEAAQLNSNSYLANFYFANLSLRDGDGNSDALVETSLRKCLQLNPAFAPAYDALAQFYALRREHLDEAQRLSHHAIELEPENINYRVNAAQVFLVTQQFHPAIQILRDAKKFAKPGPEEASIQERIDRLQTYVNAIELPHPMPIPHLDTASQPKVPGTPLSTEPAPRFPPEGVGGPLHNVRGRIRNIHCYNPAVMSLELEIAASPARAGKAAAPAKTLTLYSNNYYTVVYTLANFTQTKDINPCTDITGLKASVNYAEVYDPSVAGEVLTIELSK